MELIVRQQLGLSVDPPPWLDVPAMMRIAISTPQLLERLKHVAGPFSFFLCPLIDVAGYPHNIERAAFTAVIPFTKDRHAWVNAEATNIYDGRHYRLAQEQTAAHDTASFRRRLGPCCVSTLATQNSNRSHQTERRVRPKHAASCSAPT